VRVYVLGLVEFAMTRSGLAATVSQVSAVVPAFAQVKVGIEAAGHYHRPVLDYRWPPGWEVLELNPAQVAEQRRVSGRRRVKTDVIDLQAITELVLAGRGQAITDRDVIIGELAAWATHRAQRVVVGSATKNQLLGQLDRAFPGLTRALPDVLGTRIGRLVAGEFADPARLSALSVNRLIRFAAARDIQLRRPVAERLVIAAADALPTRDGVVARRVLATDLRLLADLDTQIDNAECELAALLPASPYATLTSVPGWGCRPGIQLRCRPGQSGPMAGSASGLPGVGTVPNAVRIRRQTPRWKDQPGRQRGAAPSTGAPSFRRGTPAVNPNRKRHQPESALHNCGRDCHAGRTTKGRIRCREGYGGPERVAPSLAWHPALRP
jgi:transposase